MQRKFTFMVFLNLVIALIVSTSVYAGCEGNCINGQGRYLYKDGQVYKGSWLNGKKHGQGHFIYKDKSTYRGEWKAELRHGNGVYTWTNGQTYEGQFVNNHMDGYGVLKYANGARYDGEIKGGIPHGKGTMLYTSGQKYVGQWSKNKKHGQGEFYWPSGRKYSGEFFQDKLTGKGTYTHNNKSMQPEQKPIDPREAEKAAQLYAGKEGVVKKAKPKVVAKNSIKSEPKPVVKKQLPTITKQNAKKIEKLNKAKKIDKNYRLTIVSQPKNATIRILNIKPKYQPDMPLSAGNYEVEVSSKGYETKTTWVKIQKDDLVVPIQLAELAVKPMIPKTNVGEIEKSEQVVAVQENKRTKSVQAVNKSLKEKTTQQIANNTETDKEKQQKLKEKLDLAKLKEEIDELKKQIKSNQKSAVVNTQLTSTLPEIKEQDLARHALIIGNSGYDYSPLKNPVNDAKDIAGMLKSLGFDVILKTDVDQEQMEDAIADFGRDLTQGGIGLFYYAGHGIQYEGDNYLIPIDSKIKRQKDVRYKAVNLGQVLDEMGAARNGLNVAIIDACRNNPLPRSYRSGQRGLARVNSPQGTLIAYATSPGATAADGDGRNGLYTKHLLNHLQIPNITVEQVLKRVARDVREESAEQQTPWMESSFTGEFYFSKKK